MKRQRGIVFPPMLLTALPYIVGITLVLGGLWWVHHHGYKSGAADVQAKWDKAVRAQKDAEEKQINAASTSLETGNAQAKIVYRTITRNVDKIVTRDVYRNVCLEPDGLRAVNDALVGALSAPAQPDSGVPKANAAR